MVELTWEGKYDENGERTAPLRLHALSNWFYSEGSFPHPRGG
jgi:hypothetical protein